VGDFLFWQFISINCDEKDELFETKILKKNVLKNIKEINRLREI
jgi:hypothetical protein